jgi:hypothetical protein
MSFTFGIVIRGAFACATGGGRIGVEADPVCYAVRGNVAKPFFVGEGVGPQPDEVHDAEAHSSDLKRQRERRQHATRPRYISWRSVGLGIGRSVGAVGAPVSS